MSFGTANFMPTIDNYILIFVSMTQAFSSVDFTCAALVFTLLFNSQKNYPKFQILPI